MRHTYRPRPLSVRVHAAARIAAQPRAYGTYFNPFSVGGGAGLSRGSDLTGSADSQTGMLSAWVKVHSGGIPPAMWISGAGTSSGATVYLRATTFFDLSLRNSGGVQIGLATSQTIDLGVWHHLMVSWDLSAGRMQLYVDDVDWQSGSPTILDDYVDWTVSNHYVHAPSGTPGGNTIEVSEFYVNNSYAPDISITANRRKFISATGGPVLLSDDGSAPSGSSPIVYLRGDHNGLGINSGTGGNFSVIGTLLQAQTTPGIKSPAQVSTFQAAWAANTTVTIAA